jgi:hypothetical protein
VCVHTRICVNKILFPSKWSPGVKFSWLQILKLGEFSPELSQDVHLVYWSSCQSIQQRQFPLLLPEKSKDWSSFCCVVDRELRQDKKGYLLISWSTFPSITLHLSFFDLYQFLDSLLGTKDKKTEFRVWFLRS